MRDNFLVVYFNNGKTHNEYASSRRIQTIKLFAERIIHIEFIG